MTDRERLIDLIKKAEKQELLDFFTADLDEAIDMSGGTKISCSMEYLADYLLEHGVIVPPCKVGDILYYPRIYHDNIGVACAEVENIKIYVNGMPIVFVKELGGDINSPTAFYPANFGDTVFLTREEAEKALKEQKNEGMRYMPKRNCSTHYY